MRERTVISGRYEVRAALGRGGMAEVWEGYDLALDRRVAVKVIRRGGLLSDSDYAKAQERFARECRVTAKVEHTGVPVVYDVGIHEHEAYLVMQLVPGQTLGAVLAERGPLPVAWVAAIGAQVCSVLAAAHAASLVHRDLKPSNVMLCPDGSVKVLDFGIAAVLDDVDLVRLTTTGFPVGSASYMAPEQVNGHRGSPATDLYGLGCVLYELLAESPPFRAETPIALLQCHLNVPPPDLRPIRPDVPASLADLVSRMLAKDPGDRPGSASEVYRLLVPHVTVDAAPGADLGPTRPYHFPFGPLPVLRHTAPDTVPLARTSPPAPDAGSAVRDLHAQQERARRLMEEGRVTRAGQVLADATRAAAAALRADHPEVVDARVSLANTYLLGGDYERALVEFERVLPDLRRQLGPDHALVRGARHGIAECYAARGDSAGARSRLRALLDEIPPRQGDLQREELREQLRQLGEVV